MKELLFALSCALLITSIRSECDERVNRTCGDICINSNSKCRCGNKEIRIMGDASNSGISNDL